MDKAGLSFEIGFGDFEHLAAPRFASQLTISVWSGSPWG